MRPPFCYFVEVVSAADPQERTEHILIVEDEEDIAEILALHLARDGYQVSRVADGLEAYEVAANQLPDLILLDLMLPGMDGLEVCRRLRADEETRSIPIVMVSARGEEMDRVVGLEVGADDYVSKPFSPREVVLRVGAVLRRGRIQGEVLRAGVLVLDPEAHTVEVDGEAVHLTATEFRLLHYLMKKPGRVRTRERLLHKVWGYNEEVESRTIDTHVRRLRKKLGSEADRLETVVGVGYRLREDNDD